MFALVTGTPGAGKTSSTLLRFKDVKDRPVFYRGIRDLSPDLGWFELTDEQGKDWQDNVPEGGIVIIDEAQQLFPVRPSSREVPAGLKALETHRHKGWDVIFITQEPGLLDSHARKIANEHFHYVRPFQAPMITEYHCGTGAISPGNRSDLARCSQKRKPLPKAAFGLYHSAEVHTHKFNPPKMLFILGALVLAAVGTWWWFFSSFSFGGVDPDAGKQTVEQGVPMAPGTTPTQSPGSWAELLTPAVSGVPYTAPIYREAAMNVQAVPVVSGCMAFRPNQSDCRCYTQQGTRIRDMSLSMCKRALADGVFNHLASADSAPSRLPDESPSRSSGDNG
jgi:hypothetical protein